MAKKIAYKRVNIERVRRAELQDKLRTSPKVIVGIDVAKTTLVVAVAGHDGQAVGLFEVQQATQLRFFLTLLEELRTAIGEVELVMEPTGTYGDVLRYQAGLRQLPVRRVRTKHVHDAKEVFDNVPSKHDGKDACLIAWLHAQGRSEAWDDAEDGRRQARALIERRDLYADPLLRNVGKLEGKLTRHWPELGQLLSVAGSLMLVQLLSTYPSPAEVRAAPEAVRQLLGRFLPSAKVEAIVASAQTTLGMPMVAQEKESLKELASEMLRAQRKVREIDQQIAQIAAQDATAQTMVEVLGPTTAMVVLSELGDPARYKNAHAYEKAAGLNLRERSSGGQESGLHLTKRGPGRGRKYLYLAALRLLRRDRITRAWYSQHVAAKGKGAAKLPVVVAVMRKLVRALYHLAKGAVFDATKLFDVRRLALPAEAACPPTDMTLQLAQALLEPDASLVEPCVE